jgi:hypothetical protein
MRSVLVAVIVGLSTTAPQADVMGTIQRVHRHDVP